jgi:opacity protein-like surface antigen
MFLVSSSVTAKGLDELSPETTEPGEPAPTEEPAAAESTAEETVAAEVTPPPPPSETSKAIANKLFLTTGFGFSTLAGESGEYAAGGAADVVVGYVLDMQIMGFNMAVTYRYQPIDFTLDVDNRSYRGVIEGHHFGSNYFLKRDALTYVVVSELGVMRPSVLPLDGLDSDDGVEKMGVNVTVGGGVDYQVMDKVSVGGRLMVGSGTFTVVQLATAASFMF